MKKEAMSVVYRPSLATCSSLFTY